MWKYYTVLDPLRHDGKKYPIGSSVALDDTDSSTNELIALKVIDSSPTGDAPNPNIDPTALGLPDSTQLPGEGLIHRNNADNWSFVDEIESVSE